MVARAVAARARAWTRATRLKEGARLPSAKRRKKPVAAAEPPPYNAADAARVRALVARLGLTQREVASACGVTTSD